MSVRLHRLVLVDLSPAEREALLHRSAVPDPEVRISAAAIVEGVRTGGDTALAEAGRLHGGSREESLRVAPDELTEALASLPDGLVAALRAAADNLTRFHRAQLPSDQTVEVAPGIEVTRRWSPLRRVGAYVPGGLAAYPSSLLMTVVPARVAGVEEVAVASPAGPDGVLSPALLGAAALLEIEELYVMGGAQAVAALAYGTETVERVDKIVGPGNPWVTAAKLAVFGDCAIDLPAGPSEVMVVADGSAPARLVAADLLSQAEHGADSPALLVTPEAHLVDRVEEELEQLLPGLERRAILAEALERSGRAVICPDLASALDFADRYAPEHLTLLTEDPDRHAEAVRAAGSVFLGAWTPESAGDYASGANHVLPTGGLARACSPLGVEDFGSWRQVQRLTEEGLAGIRRTVGALATAEGLTAHRLAVEVRFQQEPPPAPGGGGPSTARQGGDG